MSSFVWLLHAWRSRKRAPRADAGLYLHPLTFLATVTAGISAAFVAYAGLDSLRPVTAATTTPVNLYGMAAAALASGYVVFASGYARETGTERLPSLHAVGVWAGTATLAAFGLVGALLGVAGSGGWFAFWMPLVSIPAFTTIVIARSGLLRNSGQHLPEAGRGRSNT